jgi:hypothetical protein
MTARNGNGLIARIFIYVIGAAILGWMGWASHGIEEGKEERAIACTERKTATMERDYIKQNIVEIRKTLDDLRGYFMTPKPR